MFTCITLEANVIGWRWGPFLRLKWLGSSWEIMRFLRRFFVGNGISSDRLKKIWLQINIIHIGLITRYRGLVETRTPDRVWYVTSTKRNFDKRPRYGLFTSLCWIIATDSRDRVLENFLIALICTVQQTFVENNLIFYAFHFPRSLEISILKSGC